MLQAQLSEIALLLPSLSNSTFFLQFVIYFLRGDVERKEKPDSNSSPFWTLFKRSREFCQDRPVLTLKTSFLLIFPNNEPS